MKNKKYRIIARILALIGIVAVMLSLVLVPASAFYDYESGSLYVPIFPLSYINIATNGVYRQIPYFNDVNVDFGYMLPEKYIDDYDCFYYMDYPENVNFENISMLTQEFDYSYDDYINSVSLYLGYVNLSLGFDQHTEGIIHVDNYYQYLPQIRFSSQSTDEPFRSWGSIKGCYVTKNGNTNTVTKFEYETDFSTQKCSGTVYLFKELIEYLPEFDYLYISEAYFSFLPSYTDYLIYTSGYFESYDGCKPFIDPGVFSGGSSGNTDELELRIEELESSLREHQLTEEQLRENIRDLNDENENLTSEVDSLNSTVDTLENRVEEKQAIILQKDSVIAEKDVVISEKDDTIHNQSVELFELRNVNALDKLFSGIASAIWDGLDQIGDFGYSYVDGNNVERNVTIGSLLSITIIGVVAFFVIRLIRGGR